MCIDCGSNSDTSDTLASKPTPTSNHNILGFMLVGFEYAFRSLQDSEIPTKFGLLVTLLKNYSYTIID